MLIAREILHYFSLKYHGDWESIYDAINNKEKPSKDEYELANKDQTKYITILDDEYPKNLKISNYPPFVLFYKGDISLLNSHYLLTSIGTRSPTKYQQDTTFKLIKEVETYFKSQVTLVSGMAKGLDSISMSAAITKKAKVISVLGNGIDLIYPIESKNIYDYCLENGLIISEYPNKVDAGKEAFIKRNRIIAGLSDVIFVGGGKKKSGTSTTIRFALDYNKDILALPCNITGDDLTNSLISDGAEVVLSSKDIINRIKNRYD